MPLFSFFYYKNREQEGKTGPVWGIGSNGKGEIQGKEFRG
jgi:hypothetical protein